MNRKKLLLQELTEEYKRYFESKMASVLMKETYKFSSINKISAVILGIILTYKNIILDILEQNKIIATELFSKGYYGHLDAGLLESNKNDIFDKIVSVLKSSTKPNQIIHIHSVFNYRILNILYNHSELKNSDLFYDKEKIKFCEKLISSGILKDRGRRKKIIFSNNLTKITGISHNLFFQNKLEKTEEHFPAMNYYQPEFNSFFYQHMQFHKMPFVAGASYHMITLLKGALAYRLMEAEIAEYAFLCAAYMINGGNHSFHETMSIAEKFGVPYTCGCYNSAIPKSLKITPAYKVLQREFPEFLEENLDKSAVCSYMLRSKL